MSTTSEVLKMRKDSFKNRLHIGVQSLPGLCSLLATLFALSLLAGCIQGPWDYVPENEEQYKGIWVYGHVVGGRPVSEVCFVKLNPLDETYTLEFPFYDSAEITIEGDFNGSRTSMTLEADDDIPNCFNGDSSLIAQNGGRYSLDAVIYWDSAGQNVRSHLYADTYIPAEWKVDKNLVSAAAKDPSSASMDDMATLLEVLEEAYGDTIFSLLSDTSALMAFYSENEAEITRLLGGELVEFQNGDTLTYMTGELNANGYYFPTSYSEDARGVLYTLGMDSTGGAPKSMWSDFGDGLFTMDTMDYAKGGYKHRLFYTSQFWTDEGMSLDTLLMFNFYFGTGRNTIYFYGVDSSYNDYINTAMIENENPKVEKLYNIENGAGFFSGMALDSAWFYIKAPDDLPVYDFDEARASLCRSEETDFGAGKKEGYWPDNWVQFNYCRNFYRNWCEATNYAETDCLAASMLTSLENGHNKWHLRDSLNIPQKAGISEKIEAFGERLWCAQSEFTSQGGVDCAPLRQECQETEEINGCKDVLQIWCKDQNWDWEEHPQCGPALVSYIVDHDIKSGILGEQKALYCSEHPEEFHCNRSSE